MVQLAHHTTSVKVEANVLGGVQIELLPDRLILLASVSFRIICVKTMLYNLKCYSSSYMEELTTELASSIIGLMVEKEQPESYLLRKLEQFGVGNEWEISVFWDSSSVKNPRS
jgi:hypothetical protein